MPVPELQLPQQELPSPQEGLTRRNFLLAAGGVAASTFAAGYFAKKQLTHQIGADLIGIFTDQAEPTTSIVPTATIPQAAEALPTQHFPLQRTKRKTMSYKNYAAITEALPQPEPFQLGAEIQIITAGGRISPTQRAFYPALTGDPSMFTTYETTGIDAQNHRAAWANILSQANNHDEQVIMPIKNLLFNLLYIPTDGSLLLYDPTLYPDQNFTETTSINELITNQLDKEQIDPNSSDYTDRFHQLAQGYLQMLAVALDETMAVGFSAALTSKRIETLQRAKTFIADNREAIAADVEEFSGGIVSTETVLNRIDHTPVKVYDYLSKLALDPAAPAPNFAGFYNQPNVINNIGAYFMVDINYADDLFVNHLVRHELEGHASGGIAPFDMGGSYGSRRTGGTYTFSERTPDGYVSWAYGYGTWFDEATADLIALESNLKHQSNEKSEIALNKSLEDALLQTLLVADVAATGRSPDEAVVTYLNNEDNPKVAEKLKAIFGFRYANRTTDGPQGFDGASYPFEDTLVRSRKELSRTIDGAFGPGFFNRINLVLAKAERYDQAGDNGGHANETELSGKVIHCLLSAFYNDTHGNPLQYKLAQSPVLSLPWIHGKPDLTKTSATDSPAYLPFTQKYPTTYTVLNSLLGAEDIDTFVTTISMIRAQIDTQQ